ncbi:hypothetical protein GCM10009616_36190 [Microlunatus lacustris]
MKRRQLGREQAAAADAGTTGSKAEGYGSGRRVTDAGLVLLACAAVLVDRLARRLWP